MVCESHPKEKQDRHNSCHNHKCCEAKDHYVLKKNHLKHKKTLKRKPKISNPVRVSKRSTTTKNMNHSKERDSEIDETSNILSFLENDGRLVKDPQKLLGLGLGVKWETNHQLPECLVPRISSPLPQMIFSLQFYTHDKSIN